MTECKTQPVPSKSRVHLLPDAQPNSLPDIPDDEILVEFQALVGSLLYLALTLHAPILYSVIALAQFNAKATRKHLLAAKQILRYVALTRNIELRYGGDDGGRSFYGMSDADWASDESDRVSISGYVFFIFGALVSFSSRKQKTLALSSTEAEYMAITHELQEGIWIMMFLNTLGVVFPRPFPLLCDNKSAIDLSNSESTSSRSKHIDIKYHFIRKHVEDGTFSLVWISTKEMTADILTKPLTEELHNGHVARMGYHLR